MLVYAIVVVLVALGLYAAVLYLGRELASTVLPVNNRVQREAFGGAEVVAGVVGDR
jgi:hypothetical protein